MPISHDQCAPYLATTLLRVENARAPTVLALRDAIVARIKKQAQPRTGAPTRRTVHTVSNPTFRHGELQVGWVHYSETRAPAWYLGGHLKDEQHHVVFVATKNNIVTLTFSDTSLRTSIVADIKKRRIAHLNRLRVLTAKQINDAFVGRQVKTLWLSGAHHRTATKADTKILTGIELEAALNPLEDQSYYFSSVRSTIEESKLSDDNTDPSVVIGATPRNGRVWVGPSKTWHAFIDRIEALIDAATEAITNPSDNLSPLPILARPVEGVPEARMPYDMVVIPESISVGAENENDDPWLREFSDAARFNIIPQNESPNFEAEVFWGGDRYGKIKYDFVSSADSSPLVKTTFTEWAEGAERHAEIRKICENTDLLTVYYDTGHTFSRAHFYETQFRDMRFTDWRWVRLRDFDVAAEKPLIGKKLDIPNIGSAGDVSLFGFVVKNWSLGRDGPRGWLICDDGSMESADFIHFDDRANPPHLTLIHAKASSSNRADRNLSVSDYEIVVGQAVKNLRYLDRTHVSEKLAANKDSQIGQSVWRDGQKQRDRTEILRILSRAGARLSKTVCVFQPRARKSEVDALGNRIENRDVNRSDVRRLRQLDALLLAARGECLGLGANFIVIGADDSV